MRGFVFWLCLCSASGLCFGQAPTKPRFQTVGVADGLPSSNTNSLALDRDGYLWIGTRDGLARYDGVGYRIYRHQPGKANGLPGNSVQTIFVDAENRVWVSIEGQGLSVLDADRRGFRHFNRANRPLLRSNDIWPILSAPNGDLWFGTFGGGLYRIDAKERMTRFQPVPGNHRSVPADNILALAVDSAGTLWVGTTSGLARWTGQDFERLPIESLSGPVVYSLSAEPDGSLWIGTDRGLDHRFADGRIEKPAWRERLPDIGVNSVLRDTDGTRWISTRRGLASENKGVVAGIDSARTFINQTLQDNEGGLWVSTLHDGLLRLPAGWRNFSVLGDRNGEYPLAHPTIRARAASRNGRAWLLGASGALDLLDLSNGRIEHRLPASTLPDRGLASVIERRDGSVWIGHKDGLSRYDPATGAFALRWPHAENDPHESVGQVSHMAETADGLLWLASYGRGLQARASDGRLIHRLKPHDGQGLESPDQHQLQTDPDGALWIAGPAGLHRWNTDRQRLEKIPGSPAGEIYGLAFVPPDTVWLHRLSALEAYRWNGRELSRFRRVSAGEGLPAVASGGLSADRAGTLWLTTARGLLRYDPVGDRLRLFGVRDGLPSQEFQLWPPLIGPNGLGLAGTNAGLVLFDPARMRGSGSPPRLVIDSVGLRRGEAQIELSPKIESLSLAPDDRDLRVSARLLSFVDPQAHRYRFRLHGYDPGWVDVGSGGERVFSHLEPGPYRLEVRATNADGLWSASRGFSFQVRAPWWRTAGAKLGWAMLGLALAWLVARQYRQYLRDRNAESLRRERQRLAEQGSEAKSRFLATLGHEIRTPMTGVLGMAELLLGGPLPAKQRSQVELIQRSGEHLLRLVNDALDLARIEAGKLTLRTVAFDVHALLEETAAMLRPLAEVRDLPFSLRIGEGTPRALLGDVDRLRQIVLNLGNNAIKFTERGKVSIRSEPEAPYGLRLEISDTGPGLSEEQQARLFQRFEQLDARQAPQRYGGSGLGLAICRELAAAMGGRIEVRSAPGQGATFIVSLPLLNGSLETPAVVEAQRVGKEQAPLRILLVEDDAMVAEVVAGLLRSLEHDVVHAPQGLAALSELRSQHFDLAFLDLDLPGIDGLELARLIRAQGRDLPLIALTARADAQAESQAAAAGMRGFLRKPVTGAMLAEIIDAQMGMVNGEMSPVGFGR